jgi:hypothetical protein
LRFRSSRTSTFFESPVTICALATFESIFRMPPGETANDFSIGYSLADAVAAESSEVMATRLRLFWSSFCAESLDWIHESGASCRDEARENATTVSVTAVTLSRNADRSLDFVELRLKQAANGERRGETDPEPNDHGRHALLEHHPQHIRGLRAEGHSDADLAGALLNGVGDCAVNSDNGQHERDGREAAEQLIVNAAGLTNRQ